MNKLNKQIANILSERFDVLLKYNYAKEYLANPNKQEFKEAKLLYRMHIHKRTGGIECDDPYIESKLQKVTLNQYEIEFQKLIKSMQENGYNQNFPIHVGNNSLLLSGAHRLAASIALGIEPAFKLIDIKGFAWDSIEILGIDLVDKYYRKKILYEWGKLMQPHQHIMILFSPAIKFKNEIQDLCQSNGIKISASFDLYINSESDFRSLIKEVYSYTSPDSNMTYLEGKIKHIRNYGDFDMRLLFLTCKENGNLIDKVHKLRNEIRLMLNPILPSDYYITCHASDSHDENLYLLDRVVKNQSPSFKHRPSIQMMNWLDKTRVFLNANQISKNDVCIVGSSVMDLFGIRKSTDVDIVITNSLRNKYGNAIVHLTKYLDIVSPGYHRKLRICNYGISDQELIDNCKYHDRWLGYKFAKLNIVFERKFAHRRKKDIRDVFLLMPYIFHLSLSNLVIYLSDFVRLNFYQLLFGLKRLRDIFK